MIDVVRAVAAAAAVKTPAMINCADAQPSPPGPSIGLGIRNLLTRVLRYFPTASEMCN